MAAQVSWSEALMAMIAMMIVLAFVLFYYCIWPIYRGFAKRKERERELYENDPRWDNSKFNFTPRIPKESANDKKYSRLAACSRTSRYCV
jgi:cbb3-type cytochrome oxidase subunit 3